MKCDTYICVETCIKFLGLKPQPVEDKGGPEFIYDVSYKQWTKCSQSGGNESSIDVTDIGGTGTGFIYKYCVTSCDLVCSKGELLKKVCGKNVKCCTSDCEVPEDKEKKDANGKSAKNKLRTGNPSAYGTNILERACANAPTCSAMGGALAPVRGGMVPPNICGHVASGSFPPANVSIPDDAPISEECRKAFDECQDKQ